MKSVRQLLDDLQQKRYVGREKELAVMRQELLGVEGDWRLLHIHGPGGIGKSALLRAFQRTARDRLILYVDGSSFLYPADFIEAIRIQLATIGFPLSESANEMRLGEAEAELINRISEESGEIVLLLDSLDRWGSIESWMRVSWLPLLTVRVKVCSAGRYPLNEDWLSAAGWGSVVRNIRLSPLNRKESDSYIIACGITNRALQRAIELFSGGIPLALSLACESALQYGASSFLEGTQTRAIIESMDRAMFQGEQEPWQHKRLLCTASLLWRFDQDLLQWILGEEIPQGIFREFCCSPYVMLYRQGGYYILDAVRQWMKADFEHRAPETYAIYMRRALSAIERRWMMTGFGDAERRKMLRAEKMFLLLPNGSFKSDHLYRYGTGFEIKAARKEDLALMSEMFQHMMMICPPFLPDDTLQFTFIKAVWEAEPSAFRVVCHENKIVGFYIFLPLNDKTRLIFTENCITCSYIKETPQQDLEYLLWISASAPEFDPGVNSIITKDILCHRISGKLVFMSCHGPVDLLCRRLGFERLPWADYHSSGGLHFQAARIDLRNDDFFNRMSLTVESIEQISIEQEVRIKLVKQVLEHYHSLNRECSLLDRISSFISDKSINLSNDEITIRISSCIVKTLNQMAEGKSQEQMQDRIIRLFYIDRIGSHETVASRLGLPMTTYYRYLNKGIRKLADDFFPALR